MTSYAQLVNVLYEHYGTWQNVAFACNAEGCNYSRTFYWKVSKRQIRKLSRKSRYSIVTACLHLPKSLLPSVTELRQKNGRGGITIQLEIWRRINSWRIAQKMTWDQWMNKAQDLMEVSVGDI